MIFKDFAVIIIDVSKFCFYFSAWHVRLAQYYKTESETDTNSHLRETLSDPIHEYRESRDVTIHEKLKKKHSTHTNEYTQIPNSKHSSDSRTKHKKRSRSKTRKRSLSKTRKHDHESDSKRRKSDSSLSRQSSTHNGKVLGYETPKKKNQPRLDPHEDNVTLNCKSEKSDKHQILNHTTVSTSTNTNSVLVTHNNSLQTPIKLIPDKVSTTPKPSPSSTKLGPSTGLSTPKKNHKKSELKAPVDLLDKIMRDMDGKNWS